MRFIVSLWAGCLCTVLLSCWYHNTQRLSHVFRPPVASLLLLACICRKYAVSADVTQLIAQRLLTNVAAPLSRQVEHAMSMQPDLLKPRAAPCADPVYRLLDSQEESFVAIELPWPVLRCALPCLP